MDDTLMVLAILVLAILLVISLAIHMIYKSRYRFTKEDVLKARREATRGSHLTKGGQIAQQLAPLLPGFCESFNPKDARFLGHPIDFVIFDGLEEGPR